MSCRPYPNADRAVRNLRRQQAAYLYARCPQRFALGFDQGPGGWSEASVLPGLEYVARGAGMSATAWSASIEQAVAVLSACGVRSDSLYDPTTDQFYPWTDPGV